MIDTEFLELPLPQAHWQLTETRRWVEVASPSASFFPKVIHWVPPVFSPEDLFWGHLLLPSLTPQEATLEKSSLQSSPFTPVKKLLNHKILSCISIQRHSSFWIFFRPYTTVLDPRILPFWFCHIFHRKSLQNLPVSSQIMLRLDCLSFPSNVVYHPLQKHCPAPVTVLSVYFFVAIW